MIKERLKNIMEFQDQELIQLKMMMILKELVHQKIMRHQNGLSEKVIQMIKD